MYLFLFVMYIDVSCNKDVSKGFILTCHLCVTVPLSRNENNETAAVYQRKKTLINVKYYNDA